MILYQKSKKTLNLCSAPIHKILQIFINNPSIFTAAAAPIPDPIREISEPPINLTPLKLAEVLARYANSKRPLLAYSLFKDTQALGFRHDLSTYSVIVPILLRSGSREDLVSLFSGIISSTGDLGFDPLDLFELLTRWYSAQRWMQYVADAIIAAYAGCNNPPEGAIAAVCRLQGLGFIPSMRACNFLLNSVAKKCDLLTVMAAFERMKGLGVRPDVYMFTILVNACCRADDIDKAFAIGEEMEGVGVKPDSVTYGIYIKWLCEHYRPREAEKILVCMAAQNVVPDRDSYRHLIKGFCDERNFERAFDLYMEMESKGIGTDHVIQSFILNSLCEAGMDSEALEEFRRLKALGHCIDKVLYSIAINAHCKMGNLKDARRLFEEMKGRKLVLDKILYTTLMDGYCKFDQVCNAWKLLVDMLESNVEPDLATYDVLSRGFCRSGHVEEALELICLMKNRGMETDALSLGSTFIENFCKEGKLKEAEGLYYWLEQKGHHRCVLRSAMISGYLICDRTQEAYEIFCKMSKLGGLVDDDEKMRRVLPKLISKLCRDGKPEKAPKVFEAMLEMNAIPDEIEISYRRIIVGFSRVKDMKKAYAYLERFIEHGFSPDAALYTALIDGYWKDHQREKACETFLAMGRKGIKPDVVTWTAMLDGYLKYILRKDRLHMDVETRKHKFKFWSLEVLKGLEDGGLEPDDVFYTVLIDGYSKIDNVQEARRCFNEMIGKGLNSDAFPYTCLINGSLKIGNVQEAQQHFDEMIGRGLMTDAFSYTALINGYLTAGKESEAATRFREMLEKEIQPDTYMLTTLLSKFQRQTAEALLGEMISKGCSLTL